MSFALAHFDMPPSANRMWRKGPFGMHPSAEYKAWKTAASVEVLKSRRGLCIDAPVEVTLVARQTHKGRDLDNIIKPCIDALQEGGLLSNDNHVRRLFVRWADAEHDVKDLNGREVRIEVRTL